MMNLRRLAGVLALAGLFALAKPVDGESVRPVKQVRYVMGTLCEITVYPRGIASPKTDSLQGGVQVSNETAQREQVEDAISAAFAELRRIDNLLSNWNPDSDLMRLNRAAGMPGSPRPRVRVGNELFARLEIALKIAEASQGVFDPTVGPLVRAWGFLPRCQTGTHCAANKTQVAAVSAARQKVGWKKIRLILETKQVEFAEPGMEIDLGGIAKGYAVERAAEVLKEHGIEAALINLGSSSLKALGVSPECESREMECDGWPIKVADPRDRHHAAATIVLRDGEALATSGTYEQTVGSGRHRRSHLIDPFTGEALGGEIGVSVVVTDAEVADALTKPLILRMDMDKDRNYLEQLLKSQGRSGALLLWAGHGHLNKQRLGGLEASTDGGGEVYELAVGLAK